MSFDLCVGQLVPKNINTELYWSALPSVWFCLPHLKFVAAFEVDPTEKKWQHAFMNANNLCAEN